MVTLISTAGATNANSYVDVATANTYLQDYRLYDAKWTAASPDDQATALMWATTILDSAMIWKGVRSTIDQALRFPRSGLVDADGYSLNQDTIPRILEKATSELGLFLLRTDRTADPGLIGKGLQSVTAGPISLTLNEGGFPALIPNHILLMLSPIGTITPAADPGGGVVKLLRA